LPDEGRAAKASGVRVSNVGFGNCPTRVPEIEQIMPRLISVEGVAANRRPHNPNSFSSFYKWTIPFYIFGEASPVFDKRFIHCS
jgi:hypothetical protein